MVCFTASDVQVKKTNYQSVKSWQSALHFSKDLIQGRCSSLFPKQHCVIHCLAISFSCEWREPGLVLSAVLISESSKEACILSKHRYKHLAESLPRSFYSLVVITVVLSLCLQSSRLMLWTESLSWGLYGHGKMKKEGKEHWRGSSAQT